MEHLRCTLYATATATIDLILVPCAILFYELSTHYTVHTNERDRTHNANCVNTHTQAQAHMARVGLVVRHVQFRSIADKYTIKSMQIVILLQFVCSNGTNTDAL